MQTRLCNAPKGSNTGVLALECVCDNVFVVACVVRFSTVEERVCLRIVSQIV